MAGALVALAALGTGACGGANSPFVASWTRDGVPVDRDELDLYRGEGHCDWESALFLHVSWPPGSGARRQFVRDPDGVVSPALAAAFDGDVSPPDDTVDTGFGTEDGVRLELPPGDDPSEVYLVAPAGAVEAWPLAEPPVGCD
ncbi:hypothetical protein JD78_01922 [Modestobacter roseus]|uniref:Uncharacterized protein n=1 Tax=Modestobacter roseus TaxID=1181884 RepID=A0A562IQS6_9ACTN|nr:hypothetical protein JD78_01922 [Modestobacter roseus]